jgi:hypothetical protein
MMKNLFMFLCSLFILSCVLPQVVKADEPSAAKEAYNKAVAAQAAKKKAKSEKWAKEEEIRKKAEAEQAEIDAQHEADEVNKQKACGKDYMNIRVGMTLDRVEKCVGEFFLHGQIKSKHGAVDHYTRGNTYLYIKNGRVVAWGG